MSFPQDTKIRAIISYLDRKNEQVIPTNLINFQQNLKKKKNIQLKSPIAELFLMKHLVSNFFQKLEFN